MIKYILHERNLGSKMDYKEIIGIVAGVFVLLSFLQKGELKIRIVNSLGAFIFVIYGILIGSISVWVVNGVLFIVQMVNIFKMWKKDEKQE